jgi:hypothetical protein
MTCPDLGGDCRTGFSVGRNTAGTYIGDRGVRSCLVWSCRCVERPQTERGEAGETSFGVLGSDSGGVYDCCGVYGCDLSWDSAKACVIAEGVGANVETAAIVKATLR